jgi:ribosomal protein L12E/L44/L45/RPP1/RPP2
VLSTISTPPVTRRDKKDPSFSQSKRSYLAEEGEEEEEEEEEKEEDEETIYTDLLSFG